MVQIIDGTKVCMEPDKNEKGHHFFNCRRGWI